MTEAYDINAFPASERWQDHTVPDCPCGATVASTGVDDNGDAYIMYSHKALPVGA